MRLIRPFLLALLALLGAALIGTPQASAAGKLTIFGDSYSDVNRRPFPNWAEQLLAQRRVTRIESYARSGATAARVGGNTFAGQIAAWRQRGGRFAAGDTVAVYLGYNDILRAISPTASRAGYDAGINALLAGGAGRGGARLILIQPHDIGGAPENNRSAQARSALRQRTLAFDGYVASVARRAGATAVNLVAVFDGVVRSPGSFGLTNVTTADPARAATTALYDDRLHFGQKGQSIIARAVGGRVSARVAASLTSISAPAPALAGRLSPGLGL